MLKTIQICFIVSIPCIISGITVGFSSIAEPQMRLEINAASWFGCLYTLTALLGTILTGFIIDRVGRKITLMISPIPGLIGYFLLSCYTDLPLIFLGRGLTGVSLGAAFYPGQVYAAECLDSPSYLNTRSSFCNWATCAATFGFLLVFVLSIFMSYRYVAAVSFIMSIITVFLILIFLPESPVWLHYKGKTGDAEWSQKLLRIPSYSAEEVQQITICQAVHRKDIYKPTLITTVTFILMMSSGSHILSAYMVDVISDKADEYTYILCAVTGALSLAGNILELILIPYTGVRKLCLFTSFLLTICMFTYGFSTLYHIQTMRVLAVWAGMFAHSLGFYTVPRGLLGELFPPDGKQFASIPTFMLFLTATVVAKAHPYLNASLGSALFFGYGIVSLFYAAFVYRFLPETIGKSLTEISNEFL